MLVKPHKDPQNHRYDNSLPALKKGPLAGVLPLKTATIGPRILWTWRAWLPETYLLVALQLPTDHPLGTITFSLETRDNASHWQGTPAGQLVQPNLPMVSPGLVWLSEHYLDISAQNLGPLTWTGRPRLVLHKL